jgi:hypothetical protein
LTLVAVPLVARKAGTGVGTDCVGAVREHVARPEHKGGLEVKEYKARPVQWPEQDGRKEVKEYKARAGHGHGPHVLTGLNIKADNGHVPHKLTGLNKMVDQRL